MKVYEDHGLENKDLPFIFDEKTALPNKYPITSCNWHENAEFFQITDGSGTVSCDGHLISVKSGDLISFNSNRVHSCSTENGMQFRYLIVDRAFGIANGFDTNAIHFDIHINSEDINNIFNEIASAYKMSEDEPYRTLQIRTAVLKLMNCLCKGYSKPEIAANNDHRSFYIKKALSYINASIEKNFSLEEVADFVGVSHCYLSREFHKYTGYTFVAYVNRERCKRAQQLLMNENLSISEISEMCGFDNRSYFAKSFKKYIGMLPNEYRSKI